MKTIGLIGGLLIRQSDASLPVFDTTQIHARRAVDLALDHADQISQNVE